MPGIPRPRPAPGDQGGRREGPQDIHPPRSDSGGSAHALITTATPARVSGDGPESDTKASCHHHDDDHDGDNEDDGHGHGLRNAATPTPPPIDGGWPRTYQLSRGGTILVYQPQIASWDSQKRMVAWSAVSYRSYVEQKPLFGTVKIESDTKVSTTERLVRFDKMRLTEVNIPTLPKENTRDIASEIEKAIPDDERVIALDRVLANVDKSSLLPRNVEGIKSDPPPIFYSKTPALMVNIDGEPIWSPIKEVDLEVRRQHELGSVPCTNRPAPTISGTNRRGSRPPT